MMNSPFPLLSLLLLLLQQHGSWAFAPLATGRSPSTRSTLVSPSALNMAKKKKRRRKESDAPQDTGSIPPPSDELPDFDLDEEEPPKQQKASTDGPSTSEISSAMMGSANAPTRSINELIADRSLESKFEFDGPPVEGETLPDLAVLASENEVGKKKARREARVAAAVQRKEEEEGSNPLQKIPFFLDEEGEISGVKILEAGTWTGIFILVGWEFYINSPFFDRAAGNAPFLFDIVM
ncbi:expressed unknown protein [Seminavis robusta]|uniref:Uncharacterized protein n=1 Tax=Seminavis robusta TaxID=568900 RepID=A0A9N8H5M3_9STRA|nr:expressed unknown protein [Seminavis robusta]|eukprot:Sro89_g047170.1 n/a (237) ;mRNA; f:120907-121778